MSDSSFKHNSKTQQTADAFAKRDKDFCAVYVGRLNPGILPEGVGMSGYNGVTLVYTPRRPDSLLMLEKFPKLIFLQPDCVFSLDEKICAHLIRNTTSRNQFSRGKKLFKDCQKIAAADQSFGRPKTCREIIKASQYKGKESPRAMHMVLEYLEIAERMNKKIRVLPYPIDDPRYGGVEFYLHLY